MGSGRGVGVVPARAGGPLGEASPAPALRKPAPRSPMNRREAAGALPTMAEDWFPQTPATACRTPAARSGSL
eukprot:7138167-Alexandrium_andersonii.AAC.1